MTDTQVPARAILTAGCLLTLVAVLAGCGQRQPATSGAQNAPRAIAETLASAPAGQSDDRVRLSIVDKAGYQQAIDARRGKVVLVDYWATWCGPCVKQFPHTVELWSKYRERGLEVIAFSFDDAADAEDLAKVRQFLADQGATFESLVSKIGLNEAADEFDFDGALPHYAIYGRNGRLVKRLSPSDPTIKFRPEMIDQAVEEQLALPH